MQRSAKSTSFSKKAVILDFSGTMLDDIILTWNIVNDVLVRFCKRSIGFEEFRENFELPHDVIFRKYGLGPVESKEISLRIYRDRYHVYEHLTQPFDQTKSCIESLKKAGYLLGIVSQTPKELLERQLEKMGLLDAIPNRITKGECPEEKPSPLPLYQMMEMLNISRHQVTYVGDMVEDRLCAYYAGVRFVAVANNHSYHTFEKLSEANPDLIIHDLSELEQVLMREIKVTV